MPRNRSVLLYLKDMSTSIEKIQRYTKDLSFDEYLVEEQIQEAVIRNFEILGEACSCIPLDLQDKTLEIPWRDIKDMRNILIHGYFIVDPKIIWKSIKDDLPSLKKNIDQLIQLVQVDH